MDFKKEVFEVGKASTKLKGHALSNFYKHEELVQRVHVMRYSPNSLD